MGTFERLRKKRAIKAGAPGAFEAASQACLPKARPVLKKRRKLRKVTGLLKRRDVVSRLIVLAEEREFSARICGIVP